MTQYQINANESFCTNVTVQESDKYSKLILVKFDRNYIPEEIRGVNEMFLTVEELRNLGLFFIEQVKLIQVENEQNIRRDYEERNIPTWSR